MYDRANLRSSSINLLQNPRSHPMFAPTRHPKCKPISPKPHMYFATHAIYRLRFGTQLWSWFANKGWSNGAKGGSPNGGYK